MNFEALVGEVHECLVACSDAALSLDIRRYEGLSADELRESLFPITHALLGEALAIVSAIFYAFDGERDEAVQGEREQTRFALCREIADRAFIATMEFHQLVDLGRLGSIRDPWEIIAQCCDAHRRIARTLTMIEEPLARFRGIEPRLDMMCEVSAAIEIRRHYARFAQNVASHGKPRRSLELRRALRSMGTAMAMLVGSEVYSKLRVRDRRQIRALQARILEWLRDEQGAGGLIGGLRLWGDVEGVSQMLMQINRREDLIRHDRQTIEQLLALEEPIQDREALRALRGLDAALDGLIEKARPSWRFGDAEPSSEIRYERERHNHELREALRRLEAALRIADDGGRAPDKNASSGSAAIPARFEMDTDGAETAERMRRRA